MRSLKKQKQKSSAAPARQKKKQKKVLPLPGKKTKQGLDYQAKKNEKRRATIER